MTAREIKGKWFVDFWFEHPAGQRERNRKASPVETRRGRAGRDAVRLLDGEPGQQHGNVKAGAG